ncbi:MAG TPA: hypothetical protein VE733_09870 [Streptosporangiaceae bacterium]|jgi:pimeloyl-ACP methyl ester carboxylesterase|nr:hypothetical protein [Streptosporangiaceae bacterium]
MNSATMQTRTRPVDGLQIRYADTGAAAEPVILLTIPWPESLLAFRRVWPALAATGRLVAIDLRHIAPHASVGHVAIEQARC